MSTVKRWMRRVLAFAMVIALITGMIPLSLSAKAAGGESCSITVQDGGSNTPLVGASINYTVSMDGEDISGEGTTDDAGIVNIDLSGLSGSIGENAATVDYTVSYDGYVETSGSASITTDSNSITVNMTKITYTLTVNVEGDGVVMLNGTEQSSITVAQNETVSLEITPADEGYIKSLMVAGESKEVPKGDAFSDSIVMDSNKEIAVTFTRDYEVKATNINTETEGTITLTMVEGDSESTLEGAGPWNVETGSRLKAVIVAKDGYQIQNVSIGGVAQQIENKSTYSTDMTVTSDIEVVAEFVKVYKVTVTYDESKGSITSPNLEGGSVTVVTGTDVQVIAAPKENHRVTQVKIDGDLQEDVKGENNSGYTKTFSGISQDHTVEVTFAPNRYWVDYEETENGSIEMVQGYVDHGGSCNVKITPAVGYTIESITIGGYEKSQIEAEFTISNIISNTSLKVTFKEISSISLEDAGLTISEALRSDGNTLVYGRDASITVSSTIGEIKISDGDIVLGNSKDTATSGSITLIEVCEITKIEVFYQADGEWQAEWHPVEGVSVDAAWKVITFDTDAPTIDASINNGVEKDCYGADVSITVNVKEIVDGVPYSGLKKISYTITSANAEDEDDLYVWSEDSGEISLEKSPEIKIDATKHNADGVIVMIKAEDRAGNSQEKEITLNINTDKPQIEVAITGEKSAEANGIFYNVVREAEVKFIDRASSFDKDAANAAILDAFISEIKPSITWNDTTQVATLTFATDGKYNWNIPAEAYVNKAGLSNEAVTVTGTDVWSFTVDTESPKATIQIDAEPWEDILETLTFRIWKNTTITPTVSKQEDATSGIQDIWYYRTNPAEVLDETALEAKFKDDGTKTEFSKEPLAISENGTYVVYARVLDNAGNVTYVSTEAMIYETTVGYIELTPEETQDTDNEGNGIYAEDFKIGVRVNDFPKDVEDAISSGIKEVYYTITKDGTEGEKTNLYTFENESPSLSDLKRTFSPETDGGVAYITIDAEENKSNNLTVTVTAVDNAGNTYSADVKNIKINADELTGEISFEGEENLDIKPLDGVGYYNFNRTAIIKVAEDKNVFKQDEATEGIVVTLDGKEVEPSATTYTVEWTNEASVQTATVTFCAEGTYEWSFTYESRGKEITPNNVTYVEGTSTPTKFVIDKQKQAVSISSGQNDEKSGVADTVNGRGYYNNTRTLKITYTEREEYFDKDTALDGITIEAKDLEDTDIENAYEILKDNWETVVDDTNPDNTTHTLIINFNEDANYTVEISYTDIAGNVTEQADVEVKNNTITPYAFTIDRTAPGGTVTAYVGGSGRGTWENWIIGSEAASAEPTYQIWTPNPITLKVEMKDTMSASETAKVSYYVDKAVDTKDTDLLTEEQLKTVVWTAMDLEKGCEISTEQQCIVYFKVTDGASNETFLRSDGMILDKNAPSVESLAPGVYLTTVQAENGVYNNNVSVGVKVVEPVGTGSYSGIKSVSYSVTNGGTGTQGADLQARSTEYDERGLCRVFSGEFTVDAAKNNSNNVVVEVVATDNAGNQSRKSIALKIDTTKPVINISYDNNEADSTSYFKDSRVATIAVTERNFKPEYVSLSITNSEGVIPQLSVWTQSGSGDGTVWTATLAYVADGDYEFGISMYDMASNECNTINYGNSVEPTKFTIDKNDPVIRVSYDNNEAANDKYFNASREATVTIVEHNFDPNRVTFTRTADRGGVIPEVRWSHSGDEHTARILYATDGDYTFDIAVQDMAGRVNGEIDYTNSVAAKEFTVDTVIAAPRISGVVDMQPYKDEVIPVISFEDINYETYTVQLLRTRMSEKDVDVTDKFITAITENKQGGSGTNDTFAKIAENDGIYTLIVTVYDKAGNQESQTVRFTVNRFGSVYAYDEYLISLIQNGGSYVQYVEDALVITEYNADRLISGSLNIEILKDGKPIENVVYDVSPVMNDSVAVGISGWFEYVYTISKDNFKGDGIYKISVASKDNAGNTPENTNYDDKGILFRVDSTVPEITSIVGLEERIVNAQEQTVKYNIFDAIGLKCIKVYVDGNVVNEIADFTADLNNYAGSFVLSESTVAQTVRIVVEDLAGNVTDTASEKFTSAYAMVNAVTVSTNVFVRWFANKPLFWGTIGTAGVAVAGGAGFVSFRRRKKVGIK